MGIPSHCQAYGNTSKWLNLRSRMKPLIQKREAKKQWRHWEVVVIPSRLRWHMLLNVQGRVASANVITSLWSRVFLPAMGSLNLASVSLSPFLVAKSNLGRPFCHSMVGQYFKSTRSRCLVSTPEMGGLCSNLLHSDQIAREANGTRKVHQSHFNHSVLVWPLWLEVGVTTLKSHSCRQDSLAKHGLHHLGHSQYVQNEPFDTGPGSTRSIAHRRRKVTHISEDQAINQSVPMNSESGKPF